MCLCLCAQHLPIFGFDWVTAKCIRFNFDFSAAVNHLLVMKKNTQNSASIVFESNTYMNRCVHTEVKQNTWIYLLRLVLPPDVDVVWWMKETYFSCLKQHSTNTWNGMEASQSQYTHTNDSFAWVTDRKMKTTVLSHSQVPISSVGRQCKPFTVTSHLQITINGRNVN